MKFIKHTKASRLTLIYPSRSVASTNVIPTLEEMKRLLDENEGMMKELKEKTNTTLQLDASDDASFDRDELIAALRLMIKVQGNIIHQQQLEIIWLKVKNYMPGKK